jgi:hypothetical protein
MRIKRELILATAVAALGVTLFAGTADATTGNGKSDCALNGQASTSPPVQLLGRSSGTYTFRSFTVDCVVDDATDGTVVADVSISSDGQYDNQNATLGDGLGRTCGTGTFTDSDAQLSLNQTVPLGKLGDEFPVRIGIVIDFLGGNGVLHVYDGGINGAGHSFDTETSKGMVQILPAPAPLSPAFGECTNAFEVAGTLHLEY